MIIFILHTVSLTLTLITWSSYTNAFLYTTFMVCPPRAKMQRRFGVPTREQATHSWPCKKHELSRLTLATESDCPWALSIVMVNVSRTGYCSHLKSKGIFLGIRGIRGMNTSSFDSAVLVRFCSRRASRCWGVSAALDFAFLVLFCSKHTCHWGVSAALNTILFSSGWLVQ
jgi:hypothetical protein